jgi:endoglucanase
MKLFLTCCCCCSVILLQAQQSWIRINQLGYKTGAPKVAVWCSKTSEPLNNWQLINADNNKTIFSTKQIKQFGAYGPFTQTAQLNFSAITTPGNYKIKAGTAESPVFTIGNAVYAGTADFGLRYMRQQRCGYNPFLKDSCHTQDGYTLYGQSAGMQDSSFMDATGGWHDASDYLQYATTTANAAYHLLMAYRDFPTAFTDKKLANGDDGKNNIADVLDEAKWGLDWLLKLHPQKDKMFNQVADDRDHISMRIPGLDSQYGKAYQRPVYFINGEPQQRGKFMNNTTGTSSTAAKMASAFALGHQLFKTKQPDYAGFLENKFLSAYDYAHIKKGVTQTVSVKSPYIYAEDNWVDDMELASVYHSLLTSGKEKSLQAAFDYALAEPLTPWFTNDTAAHYQWYPFINLGHYELAKELKRKGATNATYKKQYEAIIHFYKKGIEAVATRASGNAFNRGVPFIWCSNNLTTAFAIQCYWYRTLTGDTQFEQLEQACFDWLFGCNPWGTSMVFGLPATGDTPVDPHSAFTYLKKYPIDGGLVDGPVYTSIYKNLIGIKLYKEDSYAAFQSDLAVYHDDYGDYSTNEPTMDGTASLVYLLAAQHSTPAARQTVVKGAITRGDSAQKKIALVFTGHEYNDGGASIGQTLQQKNIKASFFLTGDFYNNPAFTTVVKKLNSGGHYMGAHSNGHLLYCDWKKPDSLLVTEKQFTEDLLQNYKAMKNKGINTAGSTWFLPPYEWYNDTITAWTAKLNLQLINFTPGTISNADYTWPELPNYRSNEAIYSSILKREEQYPAGLNGYILLLHVGTDPRRKEKFYTLLPKLIDHLKNKQYQFVTVDQLLKP